MKNIKKKYFKLYLNYISFYYFTTIKNIVYLFIFYKKKTNLTKSAVSLPALAKRVLLRSSTIVFKLA